jgi:hypothetical protein
LLLFQPTLLIAEGLPISTIQCDTVPVASFASNLTMLCGLTQATLTSVTSFNSIAVVS